VVNEKYNLFTLPSGLEQAVVHFFCAVSDVPGIGCVNQNRAFLIDIVEHFCDWMGQGRHLFERALPKTYLKILGSVVMKQPMVRKAT
jgi:hypothetical protein